MFADGNNGVKLIMLKTDKEKKKKVREVCKTGYSI